MKAVAEPAIARSVEAAAARNLRDYAETTSRLMPAVGASSVSFGDAVAAFVGAGSPLSTVKGLGRDMDDALLDAVEAFFGSHGATQVTLELAPFVAVEVEGLLEQRGYRHVDEEDVVVCTAPYDAPVPGRPVELVAASDWPELQIHVNDTTDDSTWPLLVQTCAQLPGASHFGIRDADQSWIACAELCPALDIAIFANDATLASARGTGAQTALIHARLRVAHAEGLRLVTAEVAPGSGSERNYLRCGFGIAYTRAHYARALR